MLQASRPDCEVKAHFCTFALAEAAGDSTSHDQVRPDGQGRHVASGSDQVEALQQHTNERVLALQQAVPAQEPGPLGGGARHQRPRACAAEAGQHAPGV